MVRLTSAVAVALFLVACAGRSERHESSGSGALGGTGGGGAGGSGGSAGTITIPRTGLGIQCRDTSDCRLHEDCCSCESVPNDADPASCHRTCDQSACAAAGIAEDDVICLLGRCQLSRGCDPSRVLCKSLAPECQYGELPSVVDGCWGPCLRATDCTVVPSCDSCPDGTLCTVLEAELPSYGCSELPEACVEGNYCNCMGVCTLGGCAEDAASIHCACDAC